MNYRHARFTTMPGGAASHNPGARRRRSGPPLCLCWCPCGDDDDEDDGSVLVGIQRRMKAVAELAAAEQELTAVQGANRRHGRGRAECILEKAVDGDEGIQEESSCRLVGLRLRPISGFGVTGDLLTRILRQV